MKYLAIIRQLLKVVTILKKSPGENKMLIVCQTTDIQKLTIEGDAILKIKLDNHIVSLFSYKDQILDGYDLLGGISQSLRINR